MNCFPCFQSQKSKKANKNVERAEEPIRSSETKSPKPGVVDKVHEETTLTSPPTSTSQKPADQSGNINAQTFTFRELASATKNFRQECLLGEGGFGRVYKGTLQSNGQVVAVKQLDRNGMHGNKEFLVEVMMLSLLHHPNLVKLIGYCADGDQRLLVYEFMAGGSVEDHILASSTEEKRPLDWMTRMKIAYGAAQGLEYLHDKANPPVIYRDLKSSNILLDENLEPKLSDVGLAKFGPLGDKMQASSRVMRTYGYSAPEYTRSSQFTIKSDVYSFGVVLLELITGRRVIDTTRPVDEQNLIAWAQPIFRDPKRFPDMADPLLKKRFPERSLNQAVAIAAMCLQEEPGARPLMSDAVTALGFLAKSTEPIPDPLPLPEEKSDDEDGSDYNDDDEEGDSDYDDDDDGESEEQVEGESLAQENDDVKNESNSGIKSSSSRSLDKISRSGMESNNETSTTTSGTPRKKKSQKLRSSSTHKNRKASNEEGSSSSQQKCSKSLASLNRKGSRKSKMGSASSSRKSNKKSAEQ